MSGRTEWGTKGVDNIGQSALIRNLIHPNIHDQIGSQPEYWKYAGLSLALVIILSISLALPTLRSRCDTASFGCRGFQ
jgi:hypothetical protein